ncbi:MAG: ferredoxin--NADP reductase [Gemmataceae bacterium]|nr:ferredoxin--NADP reductase [Gemmataceae bacterium]
MTAVNIPELRRERYNATVVRLYRPQPELMLLRVRPDFPMPAHEPGQYTTLGLGNWEPRFPGSQDEDIAEADETKMVRRAYSISCPILDDSGNLLDRTKTDWIEFYVVLVMQGRPDKPPAFTPRLFMLREGDRLELGKKFTGHFTLEGVKPDDTVLFLSTGTGEAPHNYMLWQLLSRGHRGKILGACCVRYRKDLGYLGTHTTLVERYPNYSYVPLVTREPSQGKKVYIQDLITSGEIEERIGIPLDPSATHVYLCGNPNMIGKPEKGVYPDPPGVVGVLEGRGFTCDLPRQRGNIHFEEYW